MNNIQGFTNSQAPRVLTGQVSTARQSFRGLTNPNAEMEVAQRTVDGIKGGMGKFLQKIVNLSEYLEDHSGEMQNQVINALFTTTLAPFFIAFNPISKQDKKTKEYTALRQPISAGIAMTGGAAMTILINQFMNKLCFDGYTKVTDGRIKPESTHFKSEFDAAFKKCGNDVEKQKAFLEKYKPEIADANKLNKDGSVSKKYVKAGLEGFTSKIQKERQELFSSLIGEKPENIKLNKNGQITIPSRTKPFRKVENLNTEKELQEYLKERNFHNVSFADFMEKNFDLHFDKAEGKVPELKESSFKKLSEIKAVDFLEKMGIVGEKTQNGGMKIISPKDLGKLLFGQKEDISEMKQTKLLERLDIISRNDPDKTIAQNIETRMANLQERMGEKLASSKILGVFEERIAQNGIHNYKKEAKVLDFASNIIAKQAKNIGTEFKGLKGYTGILFNLVTTAVTCTALNWAYPRIVEKFWPDLVKPDKSPETSAQKGGNK